MKTKIFTTIAILILLGLIGYNTYLNYKSYQMVVIISDMASTTQALSIDNAVLNNNLYIPNKDGINGFAMQVVNALNIINKASQAK